jgi:type II secretory pathway predicted ATPase ExeA
MYKEFYMMQKEPFDSHPSPEVFYKSETHRNCWNYLMHGIKANEPILLVEGDYGAGKTLLFLKLVTLLKRHKKRPAVWIPTPTYNYSMMLEKIVEKLLGFPLENDAGYDEETLQKHIYEYFETESNEKKFVYIIIDDAQEFSVTFLNKLRLLASSNFNGQFPIRLIFFAHYSFSKLLDQKTLIALAQRIRRVYHLSGLNFEETREYIYFRLLYSGASGTPVFDDNAIHLIQQISKGRPRLINNLCDSCLIIASSEKKNLVDSEIVHKAVEKSHLMGIGNLQDLKAKSASGAEKIFAGMKPQQSGTAKPDHQKSYSQTGPSQRPAPTQKIPFRQRHPHPQAPEREFQQRRTQERMPDEQPRYYDRSEDKPERPEQKTAKSLKNQILEYGRIGVIVILILVIIFLSLYILNSKKDDFALNSPANQIEKEMPSRYLAFGDMTKFQNNSFHDDLNNLRGSLKTLNNEQLLLERKIQPILQGEHLM